MAEAARLAGLWGWSEETALALVEYGKAQGWHRAKPPGRIVYFVNHSPFDEERGGHAEKFFDGPFTSEDRAAKVCATRRRQGFETFVATMGSGPRLAGWKKGARK